MSSYKHSLIARGAQAASIAAFVFVWELLVRYGAVSQTFVGLPSKVFPLVLHSLFDPSFQVELSLTVQIVVEATVLASILGILAGFLIGGIKYLHDVLDPYLVALFTVPKIILLPFFWIIFGFGLAFQLALGIVHGFLPVLLSTIYAVKSVDRTSVEVAKSLGASNIQVFRKVILPSAVPSILTGLRLCFSLSFLGVLIAQMFVGASGLGYLAQHYANLFQSVNLDMVIVITAIIGMAMNQALLLLEEHFGRWRKIQSQSS